MYIYMYIYIYIHVTDTRTRRHLGDALDELGAGVIAHVASCVACSLTDIHQHTSSYVSIRQHTSAYVSIRHLCS